MKEARIECLVREFPVHDLRLNMRRGDVEWKPEDAARGSRELAEAVRIGAVAVRYVERCQVAKPPPQPKRHVPPSVRMSRPNMGGMVRPPPAGEPVIDKEAVKEAIREEVREALAGAQNPGMSKETLKEALREVLGETVVVQGAPAGGAVPTSRKATPAADPVYIPSNIVDKDAKADITADKSESESDDLDAAAAALAATKPKTTRKRRTAKE